MVRNLRTMGRRVGFGTPGRAYGLVVAVAVALLAAGIAVPFLVGERGDDSTSLTAGPSPSIPASAGPGGTGGTVDPGGTGGTGADGAPVGTAGIGPAATGGGPGAANPAGPTPTSLGQAVGDVVLTASDRGVTAESITVAVLYVEASGYGQGANEFLGDAREQWAPFLEDLEARGGILGRRLDVVWVPFDPLDAASQRSACLSATEDHQAFAVLVPNNYVGPEVLCITDEHQTPLVAYDSAGPDESYAASHGYWITAQQNWSRNVRINLTEFDRMGLLEGRRIGVLTTTYPPLEAVYENALLPTLTQLGYEPAAVFTFPGDIAAGQAQVPSAVSYMKSHDVDTIIVNIDFLTTSTFVQNAEIQQLRPQYLSNEPAGLAEDAAQFLPAAYDGAIGFTAKRTGEQDVGIPEAELDAACQERYRSATGNAVARGSTQYRGVLAPCWILREFEAAAIAAGPDLTRQGLVDALGQRGPQDMPGFGGGSLVPGKSDVADLVRLVRFDGACRCFLPADDFRAPT